MYVYKLVDNLPGLADCDWLIVGIKFYFGNKLDDFFNFSAVQIVSSYFDFNIEKMYEYEAVIFICFLIKKIASNHYQ